MAYKLKRQPARAAGGRALTAQRGQQTSPLVAAIARQLREGNAEQLTRLARAAAREAPAAGDNPRLAVALLIAAGQAARALGELDLAQACLAEADVKLPDHSSDLLAQLRREQVRLLLDRGQIPAALAVVTQVDCTVIERGREEPVIARSAAAITPDTLLLHAEVLLTAGALDEARAVIEDAMRALGPAPRPQMARAEAEADGDRRNYLRLLQAVYVCRTGEERRGAAMLRNTSEWVGLAEAPNYVLLGRCEAATGEWQGIGGQPPRGISLVEARRWQAAVIPVQHAALRPAASAALSVSSAGSAPPASPVFVPHEYMGAYAEHIRETATNVAASITTTYSEQLLRLAESLQPARAGLPLGINEGYVYGGRFPHIDLASVIAQAEMQRETAYIQVTWNTPAVETTILAGRLSALARCGVGYVWLRGGAIIDATLCTPDPPPSEAGDEASALAALTCLLQLGLGIGLDHAPDGQAFCYPDASAGERPARIRVPQSQNPSQSLMHALVVERETQLGVGTAGGDTLGEWER